jgi:hypothetical protein
VGVVGVFALSVYDVVSFMPRYVWQCHPLYINIVTLRAPRAALLGLGNLPTV